MSEPFMSLSSLPEVSGVLKCKKWTPDPRWGSCCGCLMPPVGLVVLVGVRGHRDIAKSMLEVNRSEGKRGSADAGLLH